MAESSQGPASEILAAGTETERKGEVTIDQQLGLVLLHKHSRSTAPMLLQRRGSHTPSSDHIIGLRSILFCTGKLRKRIQEQVTQKNELICSFFTSSQS